jgi:hypothetical protein
MEKEKLALELLSVLDKADVQVRILKSSKGTELTESGFVKIKGENILFLEKDLPDERQIELYLSALRKLDLNNVFLPPKIRALIEKEEPAADLPGH